jgi:hypothetical protein
MDCEKFQAEMEWRKEKKLCDMIPRNAVAQFGPAMTVLDIGCDAGRLTAIKAKYFGLPAAQCFGLEVRQVRQSPAHPLALPRPLRCRWPPCPS